MKVKALVAAHLCPTLLRPHFVQFLALFDFFNYMESCEERICPRHLSLAC